nr:Retrovirus-related Pol polyprotein from transposon TNT 1-94 [Ipomoea batatas]
MEYARVRVTARGNPSGIATTTMVTAAAMIPTTELITSSAFVLLPLNSLFPFSSLVCPVKYRTNKTTSTRNATAKPTFPMDEDIDKVKQPESRDSGSLVDIEPVSRRDTDDVDEEQEVPSQVLVDPPRRSDRERRPSTRYSPSQYVLLTDGGEPESYEEAMEKSRDSGSLVDIEPVSRRDTNDVDEVQENVQNGDPPRSSSQQPNPSSQPIPESPQAIPESQPIPDSAPENPFDEIHEGNDFVYNDETENAFVEVEVGDGEIHSLNLPDESDNPFVEFEVGNDEVHNINLPRNPENSSHEVQLGDEVVQLVQVPFLRESKTKQVRKAARE